MQIETTYYRVLPDADLGNTQAEQLLHQFSRGAIGEVLPKNTILYITMEPCNKRLGG